MSKPNDNASDKMSMLGRTLTLTGTLFAAEDLLLEGRVEGSIQHTGNLQVGKEGSVKGNIKAKHINVEGTVEGDMYGTESVAVQSTAQVTGNIRAHSVKLIEGARFNGGIDMDYREAAEEMPLRVAAAGK
jgi:cytoskeletal protein CcmA (bactofilin family)